MRCSWALLWLTAKALPHFGYFDLRPFSYRYARNFYDSDGLMEAVSIKPRAACALILHGPLTN
ncbi:MAG: hypothetical protein U1F27_06300 [Turneriella sp.]